MARSQRQDEAFNGVRQRIRKSNRVLGKEVPLIEEPVRVPKNTLVSSAVGIALLIFTVIFGIQIYVEFCYLPPHLTLKDIPTHPDQFIAERAMNRLLKLTALGPRVSGSKANEVDAIQVLQTEIAAIIKKKHASKRIEFDIQRVSGAYGLRFLDGLTNCYRNVPNVVVRLNGNPSSKHSLLVNCHFDSVPDSPGGSDDGASCANMLEILEILATSPEPLKHNVIFLFNGAEENLMHASHGFITKHKWAKDVGAFVNLEACGAGGREVLFQSGPNSPWIIDTYASTVPRPFASSMAQEIFESGIVPGDTDFRVFRDFGNVSGLDFAWSSNGYVYHTRFDNADQIPLGTLQRTGENILQLIKGLANAPELADHVKYRPGNLVYFDVLGIFVVRYSETLANILNVSAVIIAFVTIVLNYRSYQTSTNSHYFRELFKSFSIVIVSSFTISVVCAATALYLSLINATMSWYGRPIWLVLLYIIPCITTVMAVQLGVSKWQLKTVPSKTALMSVYHDVYLLIWSSILVAGIFFQVRSAVLPFLMVSNVSVATLVRRFLGLHKKDPGNLWLFIYFLGLLIPFLQFAGMQVGILSLFIPILGRAGSAHNPDLIVGLYSAHTFAFLFSFGFPLIHLEKKPKRLLAILAGIFFTSLLVVSVTSLGFPYSADPAAPKPQRYMFVHTERIYYNYSRQETNRQNGYWIIDMDYNIPHSAKQYVPELRDAQVVPDCETQLYCGLPYLMPARSLVGRTHWIPGPAPTMSPPQELKLIGKEHYHDNGTMRLTFRATGPDHMGLIFSPRPGVSIEGWSISSTPPVDGPKWQGRDTFFVYYANALDPKEPWVFHIDFKPKYLKQPFVDIALTGHHLHGQYQRSKTFQKVIDKFPPWAALTAWTSSFKSYVF